MFLFIVYYFGLNALLSVSSELLAILAVIFEDIHRACESSGIMDWLKYFRQFKFNFLNAKRKIVNNVFSIDQSKRNKNSTKKFTFLI